MFNGTLMVIIVLILMDIFFNVGGHSTAIYLGVPKEMFAKDISNMDI